MNLPLPHIFFGLCLWLTAATSQAQSQLIDSLNQQAYQLYRQDVAAAKALADRALSLAEAQALSPQIVDSYINLSRCFRLMGEWDSAYQVLDQAIALGKAVSYEEGLMNASNNLGICYKTQGKIEPAHRWFKQSLVYAQQIGNQKGQANAFNNLFVIAQQEGKSDSAFYFLEGAMQVYQQIGDSAGIARIYANQAFMFDQLQQNDSAIHYNFKALRIQEAQELYYQQALTYNQIGDLYAEKSQYSEALSYYEQALALWEEIGDITELANTHNHIGATLLILGKSADALPHLEQGVAFARETEDPFMIGITLVSLAEGYRAQGREDQQVREMLEEAVEYLEDVGSANLAVAYNGLGLLAMKQGQLSVAKNWFEQELATAEAFEDLQNQSVALYNLVEVAEKQGTPTQALVYFRQYQALHDSLLNLESEKNFNQLRVEYDTEKQERLNLELQQELTLADLEAAQQKAQTNQIIGIAAVLLLLGLGGFIWYRYRQRIQLKEQEMALEQERARQEQRRKEAEKLRELDAMKTRFFTNISHEFRTPLTLILGQHEQLQTAIEDPGLQNRLEMVGRNGHRLLDLVNQVLEVAKIEAGGMNLTLTRQDAIPFLKHILYSFESMALEKQVDLIFDSPLESVELVFDAQKMERVIFNLLANAMKFTPAGGMIRMEVQRKDDELEIAIVDSGVGIKASQLPYIFDRFYQADSSENQPQPGTGIGLSLVKELVELHQGRIAVSSTLHEGSTFVISLPIQTQLVDFPPATPLSPLHPEALPSKTLAQATPSPPAATQAEQILLIEDNPDVRAFVKEQILGFGYQVQEAGDGVEGLEKAKASIPDLIISDIMMPRLDGYGVAKGLKEDARTSHIPVILLTSKASDESKMAGLELGIDDYLLKPFHARELELRIGNLIEQRKRLRERFSTATIIRPNEVSAVSMDQAFLKKVLENIEAHLGDEQFSVEGLSEQVGLSVNHLNRKLGALIDQTAGKLIRSMRLQRAADLIKQQAGSMSEIAYDTGFSSPAHFARSFRQQFGMSPTAYQHQQT